MKPFFNFVFLRSMTSRLGLSREIILLDDFSCRIQIWHLQELEMTCFYTLFGCVIQVHKNSADTIMRQILRTTYCSTLLHFSWVSVLSQWVWCLVCLVVWYSLVLWGHSKISHKSTDITQHTTLLQYSLRRLLSGRHPSSPSSVSPSSVFSSIILDSSPQPSPHPFFCLLCD